MDGARFDQLLHSLASGISRRATLGAALSGLFATGAMSLLEPDAKAKKHHKKRKRRSARIVVSARSARRASAWPSRTAPRAAPACAREASVDVPQTRPVKSRTSAAPRRSKTSTAPRSAIKAVASSCSAVAQPATTFAWATRGAASAVYLQTVVTRSICAREPARRRMTSVSWSGPPVATGVRASPRQANRRCALISRISWVARNPANAAVTAIAARASVWT
jgi:hypothetical protein